MSGHPKRATISDVAEHAGVSRAAVSKVLRGAYGVSDVMRARVEASMDALGYRPSALARGMRGRSFTLGVFVVDLSNTFVTVLIEGIRAEAGSRGYQVFIGEANMGLTQQKQMIEAMVDRKMDGLILIAPFGPDEELEKIGRSTPTVVLGRHGPGQGYDTVASDDLAGSALIVDHLVSLGHRRISHLKHVGIEKNEATMPQVVRADGYVKAMVDHGLDDEVDVIETRWNHQGGADAVDLMLERKTPPTAVHTGTDMAGFGVLSRFHELGVPVPEAFSVVGYDNARAASLPQIALTTVDQSGFDMGTIATRLLVERIEGRAEPVSTLVTPTLVVRKTTGPTPVVGGQGPGLLHEVSQG
ncbi:LacI family transcriptional regulator [Pseudarthrobacter oxydans]|uniref:LacI family transcriptional regulator n=1 Tax=Pseudarthrobacter oxydans TaxID=1671 RepID=A0AAW8NAC3_PSEOX|nr:LacI family DNA-binding transcriptional regulator [Pseudarthrobacter oxydans]MDR6791890.1 LacI family transcriptional regulator [Pseudarthrobacter oxydans]MDR7163304.1 LacI family transcriptional regulator [Pseudarthrobacter oxydans]